MNKVLGFAVAMVVSAVTLTSANAERLTAESGDLLRGSDMRSLFADATFTGINEFGNDYVSNLYEGGDMTGDAISPDGILLESDTGRWWVRNDVWCREWDTWFGGFPACFKIVKDGDTIKFFDTSNNLVSDTTYTANAAAPR
ncbi:hypothetical protein [Pyruvatibacter sp.]|uniref:hypothetical protein n=1 Tax=Pyruvatibacter sp. TaxID=1981328 RepID=UPI0032EC2FA3